MKHKNRYYIRYVDVVYVLGHGSRWGNNEIRFSLRSVEKHLKGFGDVFIVGNLPSFLTNVIHIPCDDVAGKKERSIFNKIMAAVNDQRVSDSFVFFNDDHFVTKDIHASNFRYWYEGSLEQRHKQVSGHYKSAIENTIYSFSPGTKYTDIHTPIIYSKDLFVKNVASLDWKREYVIKSSYTSNMILNFQYMKDLKINKKIEAEEIRAKLKDRMFFSIGPYGVCTGMTTVLKELYPEPSIFEK